MHLNKKFFNFGLINVLYLSLCEILFLIGVCFELLNLRAYSVFGVKLHLVFFTFLILLNTIRKKRKVAKDLSLLLKIQDFLENCRTTKLGNPMELWFPIGLGFIWLFQFVQNGITFFIYKTGLLIVSITVCWFYISGFLIYYLELYETKSSYKVDSIHENAKSKEEINQNSCNKHNDQKTTK